MTQGKVGVAEATAVPALVQRLVKPLMAEGRDGFRDRVVMGGLTPYVQRWVSEAAPVLGDRPAEKILQLFENYRSLSREQRREQALKAFALLGEEPGEMWRPRTQVRRAGATPPFSLDSPVCWLAGVGPERARLLERIGLRTCGDLLSLYPFRYEDRTSIVSLAEAIHGTKQTFVGEILGPAKSLRRPGRGLQITKAPFQDASRRAFLVWFNQPWRATGLLPGQRVLACGTVRQVGGSLSVEMPEIDLLEADEQPEAAGLVPVYPATEGLPSSQIRKLAGQALKLCQPLLSETLPKELLDRLGLANRGFAISQIHFPSDRVSLEQARRRLAFEELFLLQVALASRRRLRVDGVRATPLAATDEDVARFAKALSFELTQGQARVLQQLRTDADSDRPMSRLLHGEVGAGKTVVAAFLTYIAVRNRGQAVVLAPTEILAEQHRRVITGLLRPLGVKVVLLTASQELPDRRAVLNSLKAGEPLVAVGTHALFQEGAAFARLVAVVIDEQHRFGVAQRQRMAEKGPAPHVLIMTATPIPRSLALTVYGDLDVSVLREQPPGRQPVRTERFSHRQRDVALRKFRQALDEGRQGYVVCPAIEDSDKVEGLRSLETEYEELSSGLLQRIRLAVLHGGMARQERETVMQSFRSGEIDALVATTVVEVGVDVPNAMVMLVENADRYGLAQLHQLRGRVARGGTPGLCLLVASPSAEEGRKRLQVLTRTNDGFTIAQEDLALRGPGEFLGTRQHGMPDLRIAHVLRDLDLLLLAREEAFRLVEQDPGLKASEHQSLAEALAKASATEAFVMAI